MADQSIRPAGLDLPARSQEGVPDGDVDVLVPAVGGGLTGHHDLTAREGEPDLDLPDLAPSIVSMRSFERDHAADGPAAGVTAQHPLELEQAGVDCDAQAVACPDVSKDQSRSVHAFFHADSNDAMRMPRTGSAMQWLMSDSQVVIPCPSVSLPGTLGLPAPPGQAIGLVIFAHGSGSSRLSPRNQEVARILNEAGFATLLFDLLSEQEAQDRANVFDIPLLASRLESATRWASMDPRARGLPIAYFGASTGAAAALWAASASALDIRAVISRGGRPDLASPRLAKVRAPTLLIVGGDDDVVLKLNRVSAARLRHVRLEVIPGASHLFEEPGALEQVGHVAASWLVEVLFPSGKLERKVP